MDVRPPSLNLYRYNFRDLLLERARNRTTRTPARSEPVITEIFVSRPPPRVVPAQDEPIDNTDQSVPPAPQGIGEIKHAATRTDENPGMENSADTVQQVDEKDDSWLPESAFKYNAASTYYKPTLEIRQRMENEVRKRKKAGLPCPHADNNFHCSALFIRCGDRIQFANPETIEQKNMPHECLFRPKRTGKYILIVDDNKAIREFCKNSIELFFNYQSENIVTAGSGFEAIEALNRFKLEGKQCGLLICDTVLPGISGFDVVDELFDRNYNTEVMLTKEQSRELHQPNDFKGLQEIVPKKTVVKKIISKPFHSQTFINALKNMDISHLFEE